MLRTEINKIKHIQKEKKSMKEKTSSLRGSAKLINV